MAEGGLGADSSARLQLDQLSEQIYGLFVEVGTDLTNVFVAIDLPLGKGHFHIWQILKTLPGLFSRRAQRPENFEDLPHFRVSVKERPFVSHFVENSAHRPHVDAGSVDFLSEQHLWGPVPECDHFMGVAFQRQSKSACKSKVSDFELFTLGVDEQVTRLEVAVHDAALVAVHQPLQQLVHHALGLVGREGCAPLVQVLLEVQVEELENQVQLVLPVDDVLELDDVWVAQLLQQRNLADRSRGDALARVFQANFLEGANVVCLAVNGLENDAVSSISEFFMSFKPLVALLCRDNLHVCHRLCGLVPFVFSLLLVRLLVEWFLVVLVFGVDIVHALWGLPEFSC